MPATAAATCRLSPPEASSLTRPPVSAASATQLRSSARFMLSSRISSAPASIASRHCATVSTSISTGRSPAAARTSSKASVTEPAAAMWLSLINAASDSDIRWLTPPPQRTAYFSSARSPGSVLRVSRIAAPEPRMVSVQIRVRVATPDRWVSRFSAVRSAVSRSRTGPAALSSTSPGRTMAPSAAHSSTVTRPCPTAAKT